MRPCTPCCLIAAMLLMTIPGWAQSRPMTAGGTLAQPGSTGDFQNLSPGNQKISRALFDAQNPAVGGPTPLTLDQIAALKGTEGWGKVFQQMKADGLITARNLGQVVSAFEHANRPAGRPGSAAARHPAAGGGSGAPMVITNGAGRSVVVETSTRAGAGAGLAGGGGHRSGALGSSAHITTGSGAATVAGVAAGHGGGVAAGHGGEHGR